MKQGQQKMCFTILDTCKTEDGQYIPVIVKEDEKGYFKTDWAWGTDREVAEACAKDRNEKMGLTEDDVNRLIMESF